MSTHLHILIAEPSAIVCNGLETLLKRLPGLHVHLAEITTIELLTEGIRTYRPDILIINPSIPGYFTIAHLKEMTGHPDMKCLALLYTPFDQTLSRYYDDQISILDSADELKLKIERLRAREKNSESEGDEQQTLSTREKEIVVCVVKGMTNREIADRLFLSTHTVITHRRNIARKLQVHSASALTVYAIVNKLVELKDIND